MRNLRPTTGAAPRKSRPARLALAAAAAVVLALALAAATTGAARAAAGVSVYWTRTDLLKSFFAGSKRVVDVRVKPEPEARRRLEARLGYALPRTEYVFYVGLTDSHVDGYAIIDEEMGQHLPITFATKIAPGSKVERVEIMIYREPYGDEVRDDRFRTQFVGRTSAAALRIGKDLVAVSGATISSHAIATGVRRALVLVEELVLKGPALATRLAGSSSS